MWKVAADLGLPRLIFVNKLDRERASFERTLEDLQSTFGAGVAPLELPIGEEAGFRGVADLLSDTAITYEGGRPTTGPIPDDMAGQEHTVHDALVEGIVVADDDLMERYLEGEIPSVTQLQKTLGQGVAAATVFPVVCGSAAKEIAIDRLASFICEIGPSPLDRPPVQVEAGGKTTEVAPDPAGPPLAWVWKTVVDRHVGKISLFKVLSGRIKPDDTLVNARTHTDERIHAPFTLARQGAAAGPGAAGRRPRRGGQAGGRGHRGHPGPQGHPGGRPGPAGPGAGAAGRHPPEVEGRRGQADDRPAPAAGGGPGPGGRPRRRDPPDPAGRNGRDPPGHRDRAPGPQVRRRGGDRAGRGPLPGDDHRHGRSRGQVQEADRRPRPVRGGLRASSSPSSAAAGFEFVDQIVGGAIPRQFIPAVQKGIEEAMAGGGTHGWPVVDVRVTCYDGKYHSVDSSEMSFKMAGALGFREAMEKAVPDPAGADLEDRGHRAGGLPGRRHGRPQRAAGPGAGDRGRRRR